MLVTEILAITGSYNNIIGAGADNFGGSGWKFNLGQANDEYYSEFETVALPESFNYFGQDFTHIYVNENGFLTFGNGGAIPINHGTMFC